MKCPSNFFKIISNNLSPLARITLSIPTNLVNTLPRLLYRTYTITCSKRYTSVHSSRIVLKNKAVLKYFAKFIRRRSAIAKPNSNPCCLLSYVLLTSTPLALSSLIRNSKSVQGLPDFIIANAFVNKTGKCFLLLVESNFFA